MDAWKMIGVMIRGQSKMPVPNRVYECPHGQGWHTTTSPERPSNN